jgi:hypothetical protein
VPCCTIITWWSALGVPWFSNCTPLGIGAVAAPASGAKKKVPLVSKPYQLLVCTGTIGCDAGTTL